MKTNNVVLASLVGISAFSIPMSADVVTDWNSALASAARASRINPPAFTRAAAITHLSVYDAVNGIDKSHRPYHVLDAAPAGASAAAAAAAAAFTAAGALFNQDIRTTNFMVLYDAQLAAIPDGQAKTDGIAWGQTVANAILTLRASDGSATPLPYTAQPTPGVWRPTPPANAAALLPHWGKLTPFSMTTGSQFRPYGPAWIDSSSYAMEFNQVKELGSATSTKRTADQTEVAQFWSDGGGTETPPGHWNHIARDLALSRGLSLSENARLFGLLNIALADAAIACWDAKYTFNLWRPITAIREAATDDNAETEADANWLPLIATPPFPESTSGHSTFSRAGATVLASYFGTDKVSFQTTSDGVPGVTRSFSSFSEAAEEAGASRIYGGIHFATANINGQACGFLIGNQVLAHFLKPAGALAFARIARAGGQSELTLAAEPNKRYTIRASSDLNTWQDLATLSATDGVIRFTDPTAVANRLRFYQAVAQ